jgi:hypothetical protein
MSQAAMSPAAMSVAAGSGVAIGVGWGVDDGATDGVGETGAEALAVTVGEGAAGDASGRAHAPNKVTTRIGRSRRMPNHARFACQRPPALSRKRLSDRGASEPARPG